MDEKLKAKFIKAIRDDRAELVSIEPEIVDEPVRDGDPRRIGYGPNCTVTLRIVVHRQGVRL
ncbi:MAG: hypothetical protein IMZ50_06095 [Candidatus Atribacteria bacterium]|nr:hypothetical protein [Candidatus Atribacteria bacterium]